MQINILFTKINKFCQSLPLYWVQETGGYKWDEDQQSCINPVKAKGDRQMSEYINVPGDPDYPANAPEENEFPRDYYIMRNKDVRLIVGLAIRKVKGVLGLKPTLTQIFSPDDDWSKGVTVSISGDEISVSAKIVADVNYDEGDVIDRTVLGITDAVEKELQLTPKKVDVKIADVKSADEFREECAACMIIADGGRVPQQKP